MRLYKNGFVVAEINTKDKAYNAWPLSDLYDDKIAEALTNEADDNWFVKYEMQHIIPDLDYIKKYLAYCNSIQLEVKVLLFESPNNKIVIDDELEIGETLGFDCIGTVYYSYFQTEYNEFKSELQEENIISNKYGLLNSYEETLYFQELRKKVIASGVNLEDFWEELPVKISIVNI